jgi:hypothetical protein
MLSVTPVAVAGYRKSPLAVVAGAAGIARCNLVHVSLFMVLDIGVQLVVALGAVQLLHVTCLMPENRLFPYHHIAVPVWRRGGTSGKSGNDEQNRDFFAKQNFVASIFQLCNVFSSNVF